MRRETPGERVLVSLAHETVGQPRERGRWRRGSVKEGRVASGCGNRVCSADDLPEIDRGFDYVDHMRAPFGHVGLEEVVLRFAAQHHAELPTEVPSVAHARAHALTH